MGIEVTDTKDGRFLAAGLIVTQNKSRAGGKLFHRPILIYPLAFLRKCVTIIKKGRKEPNRMDTTQRRKNDFTEGGIAKNILSLAIPLTVAQLTVVLYNVVDRAFIGHIEG